jgi:hypothetical protein
MLENVKDFAENYNKDKKPGVLEWAFGITAVCSVLPSVILWILARLIIDTTKSLVKKVWK